MDLPTLLLTSFFSDSERVNGKGFKRALNLFKEASRRIPAYKDFLRKAGVNPEVIHTKADFKRLPRMDKPSYISQYSLAEMSWDGTLANARYVSTSSGSTGVPFFWPRGVVQDAAVGHMFRNIYRDIFDAREKNLLFVNSFALGTWIAGFEFYNATKWAGDQDGHITIVTPSIDKSEAVNQIRRLSGLFERVVVAGYPPFVKDIVEACEHSGIDIQNLDLRLMIAGEAVSIPWKQKLLERIGRSDEYATIVNVYGMAEAGVVAHDTPLAQLVREHASDMPPGLLETHDGLPITGMYQYYPDMRYLEADPGEALALTADVGLPLIRYDTRDTGGIVDRSVVDQLGDSFRAAAASSKIDLSKWQLPFVYLNGRKDLSISLYALMIYVENVKYSLEKSNYSPLLSGLFTMSVEHNDNLDQEFIIRIELAGQSIPEGLDETLQKEIVSGLKNVNSEYTKLLNAVGERALPRVHLMPHGHLSTIPGRKHKWVKRT